MAIDEYECISCRNVTMKGRKINDTPKPIAVCANCGEGATYIVSIPGYRRDHTIHEQCLTSLTRPV